MVIPPHGRSRRVSHILILQNRIAMGRIRKEQAI